MNLLVCTKSGVGGHLWREHFFPVQIAIFSSHTFSFLLFERENKNQSISFKFGLFVLTMAGKKEHVGILF